MEPQAPRCFPSRGPEDTRRAASGLARVIDPASGLLISLVGELGAGKTVFVKGLAEGLGIDPGAVSSPTFVIASQYVSPAGRRLNHVDFYRLESADELETTGFFDLLEAGAVVAVEWGGRFAAELPRDRLEISLERAASDVERDGTTPGSACDLQAELRTIEMDATGPEAQRVLNRWVAVLSSGDGSSTG